MHLGLALLLLTAVGLPATPKEPVTSPPVVLRAAVCRAGNLWAEEVEFAEDTLPTVSELSDRSTAAPAALRERSTAAPSALRDRQPELVLRCDGPAVGQGDEGDGLLTRAGPVGAVAYLDPAARCEIPSARAKIGRCDMRRVHRPRARLHGGDERRGRGVLLVLAGTTHGRVRSASSPPTEERGDRSVLTSSSLRRPLLVLLGDLADPSEPAIHPGYHARIDRPPR